VLLRKDFIYKIMADTFIFIATQGKILLNDSTCLFVRRQQRGVSLFIVMVILLLSLIIVLGALSVANLNESVVGNQSDAQRAYGAAEALLNAARLDIRLNGRYCASPGPGKNGTNNNFRNSDGRIAQCTSRYPVEGNGSLPPIAINTCNGNKPYEGICISQSPSVLAFNTGNINQSSGAQQWSNGIYYNNNYISSVQGTAVYSGNTSLTDDGIEGVYWVEIFQGGGNLTAMVPSAGSNAPAPPDPKYPYIFRITAMAKGLKSGTASVLRVYYIPYPLSQEALNGA